MIEENMRYPSALYDIDGKTSTATAGGCQALCDAYPQCVAWTWNGDRKSSCFIKSMVVRRQSQNGAVSGTKVC